ncbi:amidase [Gluconacetobacter diazotrophicus]|uniref:Amidase n=1 Tax=Gluconacetobacter diazotrophicus TaxID=33996 RepID=A0A7W4I5T4_GLUDI|nr:amidase [Gluconacetobacter diazotrophicus]MBB2156784.1 amidase [Gluconacetobacter diazotrophicus]
MTSRGAVSGTEVFSRFRLPKKTGPVAALAATLAVCAPGLSRAAPDSAAGLVADMHAGRLAPDDLVRRYSARIAQVDAGPGGLHAILALNPDAAQQAAALARMRRVPGPLYGLPIVVKDNIETRDDLPTTAGSLALAGNVSHRDAPVIALLRAAGAIVLGKANLSEWANFRSAHASSGWSAVGGLTHNPHDRARTACGSSAGSAVAVAAGLAPAAIGTETDGSITCPASVNGIVGLKPTVGLVSRSGIVPISASQDTAGPLTRTVRDAALLLGVIAGSDPDDPATAAADRHHADYLAGLRPDALRGRRIGVIRFAQGGNPDVRVLFEAALARLRDGGAILVDIPAFDSSAIDGPELTVLLSEFRAGLNAYLAHTPAAVTVRDLPALIAFNRAHADREMPWFGQDLFERAQDAPALSDPAYTTARDTARRLAGAQGIDAMLAHDHLDALVAPTIGPAWMTDPVLGDRPGDGTGAGSLAAVAGYPHLSVPMGQVRGLPVGLSFIGPAWSEATLLALGYGFEQASAPVQATAQAGDR